MWVWGVNDKQTSDVLRRRRRLRLRLRPGVDKKNCQSALKVCNASKVSCKIDKYNADRQLLQLLLPLLCTVIVIIISIRHSPVDSRQSAGEGIKMGMKDMKSCRMLPCHRRQRQYRGCRPLPEFVNKILLKL